MYDVGASLEQSILESIWDDELPSVVVVIPESIKQLAEVDL